MKSSHPVDQLLADWKKDPGIFPCIVDWQEEKERAAQTSEMPNSLNPELLSALQQRGIDKLYTHQCQAVKIAAEGENLVVVTGTASGKTMCYNLPVLDAILKNPGVTALYLFPTKALTSDQLKSVRELIVAIPHLAGNAVAAVYDGDTPEQNRRLIRNQTNILLTNPDMIHLGILPHHTVWAKFFRGLRYIVIDEIHYYRGVLGSHFANVIRRLKRIAGFYGVKPQFILTSATIANPAEHAARLIGEPVRLVDQDGAPHGARHFLLYNPPVVDAQTGIRRSSTQEAVTLGQELVDRGIQTIFFARSRRTVEMMLRYLRDQRVDSPEELRGYRSGYMPRERRSIEQGLRTGSIRAVVATNALELGIDIGKLSAAVMVGFPGTIASTRQQAGRAGRSSETALALLIASAGPMDQFIVDHPEYLFDRTPEQALINPNNPLILLQHLRCAAFELPFTLNQPFGTINPDQVKLYLDLLVQAGELHYSGGRYFWAADQYPTDRVSLRSSSPTTLDLQCEAADGKLRTFAEIDIESAPWMVYPHAIYLHDAVSYEVLDLDLEKLTARLKPVDVDYFTEPLTETTVEKRSVLEEQKIPGGWKFYGEIRVTSQVKGYRRVQWFTHQHLATDELDLPPSILVTTGYWIVLDQDTLDKLREQGMWSSDPNDYGPNWDVQRNRARERDLYTCQVCGIPEQGRTHHVHHKIPFRTFSSYIQANLLANLVTLCPNCHKRAETAVRVRSGISGLKYVLHNLAPLFVMCDTGDLGALADPQSSLADGMPAIVLYDLVPAGIGLAQEMYQIHQELLHNCSTRVQNCSCQDGCPSCVGPAGENGVGGKQETLAILDFLTGKA